MLKEENRKLLTLVDQFARKKIAVWGDFILDEYLYGNTRRISREAPVLILAYQTREFSLGGAGNSILNLKALGVKPLPIGVIGPDDSGKKIFQFLKKNRISTEYLIVEKDFPTPLKTRILAGEENTKKQQILRIDREGKVSENSLLKNRLLQSLQRARRQCDALLISDYNYFTVKEDIFRTAFPPFKKMKIPVTLDSRFRLLSFRGVTAATPNEPEVEEALKIQFGGDTAVLQKAGRTLLKKLQSPAALITLGSKGMALFEKGRPVFIIPIFGTPDIVDVTGAGDTVISVFTAALACGATFRQAARLANYAGGIVVMKKGTATVTPLELKQAIISEN
ncbi:MAG: PfkB family carbohydrate kinase [Candidatus Aminicenantales bacterium]